MGVLLTGVRAALLSAAAVSASSAFAGPARCSYGNQDSTCTTPISSAPIPQPQCPTGAGWTTAASSVWQGSHWSAPQCNYQAPPSCPGGYTQTSSPWWDGANWVGLACAPSIPSASLPDQQQACANAAAGYGKFINPVSAFGSPLSETTNQVVNDINTQPSPMICGAPGSSFGATAYGSLPSSNGPFDLYKMGFGTYVNPGDGHVYGASSQVFACMLNPGTTQVVGFMLSQSQNAGGPCGGGGGH